MKKNKNIWVKKIWFKKKMGKNFFLGKTKKK